MEIGVILGNINYRAVLVAVIVVHFLGFIWFHKRVFGARWFALQRLEKTTNKRSKPVIMATSFLTTAVVAMTIAAFVGGAGLWTGIIGGAIIAVCIITMNRLMHGFYSQQSMELMMINTGYDLMTFVVMGAIIGFW